MKHPTEEYVEEMYRLLFAKGKRADQVSRQAALLSQGPLLPWTRAQTDVITAANLLTSPAIEHPICVRWRFDAEYVVNLGGHVLWSVRINDVHEASRWCLILVDAYLGTYQHAVTSFIGKGPL